MIIRKSTGTLNIRSSIFLLTVFAISFISFSSCKERIEEGSFELIKKIKIDKFNPIGISNLKQYVAISDSSRNKVILIDTLNYSVFKEVEVEKPVYIHIRKARLLIPSFSMDSVFIYRGDELYPLICFEELNGPTGVDAFSVFYYVQVDYLNDRVLFRNGPDEIIIGKKGTKQGDFMSPTNVILTDSLIYITDSGNKRIQVFDELGAFQFSFGESEELIWPTGICSDDDHIYVSDAEKNVILIYTKNGQLVETITEHITQPSDINWFEDKLFVANKKGEQISVLKRRK